MKIKRLLTALMFGLGLTLLLGFWLFTSGAAAPQKAGDPISGRVGDADEGTLAPQACTDWNLASDFRLYPNQENPNRDSCGNLGVWHFMSADLNRQMYALLPQFTPSADNVPGLQLWQGTYLHDSVAYLPHVGINATGVYYGTWPPNTMYAHPAPAELAVVGWHSPVNGAVSVSGWVRDVARACGDGIAWYIDQNATNLASGSFLDGGAQNFRDGAGGDLLAHVSVNQGDVLYFAIHPKSDFYCDGTFLDISVHLLVKYPVGLTPPTQTGHGGRGQVVAYTETLINNAGITDTFDLAIGPHTWDTALSTDRLEPVASGDAVTFTVNVTVPVDAEWYSSDTVVVTATSVSSPTVYSDTATFTTEAYAPPSISVSPDVLTSAQYVNEIVTRPLIISNGNGVTLTFDVTTGSVEGNALEGILDSLNSNYQVVIDAIPNRYDFSEGETGTSIYDGGNDMYDGGNYLSTNFGGNIPYFNNTIVNSTCFGGNGRYFTRKYPGLFVLVADMEGVDYFQISGNLGADGAGNADGTILQTELYGVTYYGFVKRVYNAGDPSVNHLVIVPDNPSADHTFSVNTNDDYHQVYNLSQNTRLYYLLYAGANGYHIDNGAALNIMQTFLDALWLLPPSPWLSMSPVSGTVPSDSSVPVQVTFDAIAMQPGDYSAYIVVQSNDPITPSVSVPVTMTVLPTADMGWVEGTVSDARTGDPLEATVIALGQPYTITTQPDTGAYKLWLDAGSYTLQASAEGYVTQTAVVDITAQQGIAQDFALELNVSRLRVSPASLAVTHYVGDVTTRTLTIANDGPAALTFNVGSQVTDAVLLMHLDEPAGATTFRDDSGNNNHGSCSGASCPTAGVDGRFGKALRFDGSDDYVEVGSPVPPALQLQNELSLAAWIYVTDYPAPDTLTPIVGCQYDPAASGYAIHLDGRTSPHGPPYISPPGHIHFQIGDGEWHMTEVNAQVPLNQWVHIVAVRKANEDAQVYYNGVQQPSASVPWSGSITYSGAELDVGRQSDFGNRYFNGVIDEVAIYDRDLSAQEVEALYLSGPGGISAPWLSTEPVSGTVPAYSSTPVEVTFDATGLQPDIYTTTFVIQSNDPITPSVSVPVTMTVLPTADMGRVTGAVSDAWTGLPLTATVELLGVYSMTASPDYTIWATAGTYSLTAYTTDYYTTTRSVTIMAGGVVTEDLALEPAQPRLEWAPATITARAVEGSKVAQMLTISNTGPLPLDVALHEINPVVALQALSSADLAGTRILYDRAHGEPASGEYSFLISDVSEAGAVVNENWYFPINAAVLEDYDVLWVNCCGDQTWRWSELNAVNAWLQEGGAVLVQGENSLASSGPPDIFDISYQPGACTAGTTTDIVEHPISAGVDAVNVEWTCWRLAPGSGAKIVVFDPQGQPHVVAQEQSGGKMVVVASEDFIDWHIENDDNRLLANNILAWLARPAYSDVPWLTETPEAGTIPGHSNLPVILGFDARALSAGDYGATLAIEHNDPAQPSPVELPVTLVVHPPRAFLPLILKNSE